jgi:hypothetical protein
MSYKRIVLVFASILLLAPARGTIWAMADTSLLTQNRAARTAGSPPLDSPEPVGAAPLLANENSTPSNLVRTGVFNRMEVKATTIRPVEQVQTGVFWTPQGFPDHLQPDSRGIVHTLGFSSLRFGPGVGNRTAGGHRVQGRPLRKRGSGRRISFRIWQHR